jgi:hypothetical protein
MLREADGDSYNVKMILGVLEIHRQPVSMQDVFISQKDLQKRSTCYVTS